MANATIAGIGRSPKGDPWRAFDALPRPIRDAMQDGVSPVCPLKVRKLFTQARREHGEAEAIAQVLKRIEANQRWATSRP